MRKLETEKKLWKKDEQMLNKEISRLTIRMQEEVERRTDHEFEKAHLHEQIETLHSDNALLKMELCKKSDDLNKLRLKCADLENRINNSRQIQLQQQQLQQQQHQFAISQQQPLKLMDASSFPQSRSGSGGSVAAASHSSSCSSSHPTTNWAEKCKSGSGGSKEDQPIFVVGGKSLSRRRVRDAESDFARSSNSSFGSAKPPNKAASSSSTSSSLSDDASDGGGEDWLLGSSSAAGSKTKKGKSSTLTRRKEVNFNNNVGSSNGKNSTLTRGEKASNQGHGKQSSVDDLTALRHNIEVVNQKMAKNDKEIQKLENCVQCLTLKRDEGETSGST